MPQCQTAESTAPDAVIANFTLLQQLCFSHNDTVLLTDACLIVLVILADSAPQCQSEFAAKCYHKAAGSLQGDNSFPRHLLFIMHCQCNQGDIMSVVWHTHHAPDELVPDRTAAIIVTLTNLLANIYV